MVLCSSMTAVNHVLVTWLEPVTTFRLEPHATGSNRQTVVQIAVVSRTNQGTHHHLPASFTRRHANTQISRVNRHRGWRDDLQPKNVCVLILWPSNARSCQHDELAPAPSAMLRDIACQLLHQGIESTDFFYLLRLTGTDFFFLPGRNLVFAQGAASPAQSSNGPLFPFPVSTSLTWPCPGVRSGSNPRPPPPRGVRLVLKARHQASLSPSG